MKPYIRFFILSLFLVCLLLPNSVSAANTVDIEVEYGVNGKVQMGKGFPMTITLTNQGNDFTGDLVIYSNPNYEVAGNIVLSVELPKGEEKRVQVAIPGYDDRFFYQQPNNQQQPYIRLFEGEWEKGKEVILKESKKVNPSFLQENRLVVGVLSDSPDTLNFLKLTKYNAEPIEFLQLKEADISNEAIGLSVFDLIVINDFNISTLSTQKQQAILDWVKSGGHVMLGSSQGLSQQLGEMKELELLTITGDTAFKELHVFPLIGDERPTFENVEIMTGDVKKDATTYYSDHSLPIVLNQSIGLGEVTQLAFNIGNNTLNNWEPYTKWWEELLQKTVTKDSLHGPPGRYMIEQLYNEFGTIVESFPSTFIPLTLLILLFIVYLLFLVPGLYLILKKLDKRERSWWIIPAIAIVSSVAIFAVGAKDRISGTQLNDVSVVSIDEAGKATGYGAFAILTNSGGDYSVTVKPGEINPFSMTAYNTGEPQLDFAMVEKGQEQTKITFNDVEYWSIRSAIADIQSLEVGGLTTELQVENGMLVGSVSSSLSVDLEDAYLLTGSKSYELGEIEAGTTKTISIKLQNKEMDNIMIAPQPTVSQAVIPGFINSYYGGGQGPSTKEELEKWKKFQLLNTLLNQQIHPKDLNKPLIAGFTQQSLFDVEMDKKLASSESLTLITQVADVIPSLQGEFTISGEGLQPKVSVYGGGEGYIHYNGLLTGDNFIDVEPGQYTLTYQFPQQLDVSKIELSKLKVTLPLGVDADFYLYNVKSNDFIPFDGTKTNVTYEKDASEFLSEEGTIVLMFEKGGFNTPQVQIPTISVEGEYEE